MKPYDIQRNISRDSGGLGDSERRTVNIQRTPGFEALAKDRSTVAIGTTALKTLANEDDIPIAPKSKKKRKESARVDIDVTGRNNPEVIKSPERELKKKKKNFITAEGDLEKLKEKIDNLNSAELKQQLNEAEILNMKLKKENEEKDDLIKRLLEEIEELKKRIKELTDENNKLLEQKTKDKNDILSLQDEYQKMQDKYKEDINALQATINEKERESEDVLNRLRELEKWEEDRMAEELKTGTISKGTEAVGDIKLLSAKSDMLLKQLFDQCKQKEDEKKEAEAKLEKCNKLKEMLKKLKDRGIPSIARNPREYENLKNELNSLYADINPDMKSLKDEISESSQYQSPTKRNEDDLKGEMKLLASAVEKLNSQLNDKYNMMNKEKGAAEDKLSNMKVLNEELKRLKDDGISEKYEKVNNEIKEMEKELAKTKKEIEEKKKLAEADPENNAKYKDEIAVLEAEADNLQKDLDDAYNEKESINRKLLVNEKEREQLNENILNFEEGVKADNELYEDTKELEKIQKELYRMKEMAKNSPGDNEKLKEEISKLEEKVNKSKAELKVKTKKPRKKFSNKPKIVKNDIEFMNERDLRDELSNLIDENDQLIKELNVKNANTKFKDKECEILKDQLKKVTDAKFKDDPEIKDIILEGTNLKIENERLKALQKKLESDLNDEAKKNEDAINNAELDKEANEEFKDNIKNLLGNISDPEIKNNILKEFDNKMQMIESKSVPNSRVCDKLQNKIIECEELRKELDRALDKEANGDSKLKQDLLNAANLRIENKLLKNEQDILKNHLNDERKEKQKAENELETTKKECKLLQSELDKLVDEKYGNDPDLKTKIKENIQIKKDNNKLREEKDQLEKLNEQIINDIEDKTKECEILKKEIQNIIDEAANDDDQLKSDLLEASKARIEKEFVNQMKSKSEDPFKEKHEGGKVYGDSMETINLKTENEMLKNKIEEITKDTSDVKDDLETKDKEIEQLKKNLDKLLDQISNGDPKVKMTLIDVLKAQEECNNLKDECNKLQQKLSDSSDQILRLEDENLSKENECQGLKKELQKLIKDKFKDNPRLGDLVKGNSDLRIENDKLNDRQDRLMKLLKEEYNKRKNVEEEKEKEAERFNEEIRKIISNKYKDPELKEKLLKNAEQNIEIGKLTDKFNKLLQEKTNENEINERKANNKQRECELLRSELGKLIGSKANDKPDLEKTFMENINLKNEISKLENEQKELQSQLANEYSRGKNAEETAKLKTKECERLNSKLERLLDDISDGNDETKNQLLSGLHTITDNENLEQKKTQLEKQLDKMNEEKKLLENEKEKESQILKNEIKYLIDELSKDNPNANELLIDTYKLKDDIVKLNNEKAEMIKKYNVEFNEKRDADKDTNDKADECRKLRNQLRKKEKDIIDLNKQLSDLDQEVTINANLKKNLIDKLKTMKENKEFNKEGCEDILKDINTSLAELESQPSEILPINENIKEAKGTPQTAPRLERMGSSRLTFGTSDYAVAYISGFASLIVLFA